jgi:hypothetical protein
MFKSISLPLSRAGGPACYSPSSLPFAPRTGLHRAGPSWPKSAQAIASSVFFLLSRREKKLQAPATCHARRRSLLSLPFQLGRPCSHAGIASPSSMPEQSGAAYSHGSSMAAAKPAHRSSAGRLTAPQWHQRAHVTDGTTRAHTHSQSRRPC